MIKGPKYRLFNNIFHSLCPLEICGKDNMLTMINTTSPPHPHFHFPQMKWHLMQLYPVHLPNLCGLAVVGNCPCPDENNAINMKTRTSKFNNYLSGMGNDFISQNTENLNKHSY